MAGLFLHQALWLFSLVLVSAAHAGDDSSHPSAANCTWNWIEQPLSHFARGVAGTYKQRICIYSEYWQPHKGLPVFLYTGNESPVDEYVNNTGLMWDLAVQENALVVFAEHRYFGESIPILDGVDNCIAYLSSEEALADYAALVSRMRREWGAENSAVIAFGGSYGGMLASWMRIMYPSAIDGAIAASAPIWGFPLDSCPLDSSATVVSYAASSAAGAADGCADNLKAAYVLVSDIGKTEDGRALLSQAANLCTPLRSQVDLQVLLNYLQTPLFDLAEGSYPFPSDYITYALTGSTAPLPPWAMQVMCEPLAADFGITVDGDVENVQFTVRADSSSSGGGAAEGGAVEVHVDWDVTSNNAYSVADVESSGAPQLIAAVAQAIQVWYNVTGELDSCIDWQQLQQQQRKYGNDPSMSAVRDTTASTGDMRYARESTIHSLSKHSRSQLGTASIAGARSDRGQVINGNNNHYNHHYRQDNDYSATGTRTCSLQDSSSSGGLDAGTAWNILVCNEGINLVNWWAQGVGHDLYWPPNQPRDFSLQTLVPGSLEYCAYLRGMGLYGIPEKGDVWSLWLDSAYGGTRLQYASNIFFSNGNLDPWSPAGVSSSGSTARGSSKSSTSSSSSDGIESSYETTADTGASGSSGTGGEAGDTIVKPLSKDGSVVAATIDMGGHHLDLFWPTAEDPVSVRRVRALEREHIQRWIAEAAATSSSRRGP